MKILKYLSDRYIDNIVAGKINNPIPIRPPILKHNAALGKPQQQPIIANIFRKRLVEISNIHTNIIINNITVAKKAITPNVK